MSYAWKPEYALDDPVIDKQHRQLLELADVVAQACSCERDPEVIANAFSALYHYTNYHFFEEEQLFAKLESPLLEEQRREHERLTAELKQFWAANRLNLLSDVLESLSNWVATRLVPHMIHSDQKARWDHLRAGGAEDGADDRSAA